MNIQLQIDDDEPLKRRPLGPPPNYRSIGFRMRLVSLFAALLLVLVLMQEAGNPERWAWMGFDGATSQSNQAQQTGATKAAEKVPLPEVWKQVTDNTAVGHVGDSGAWSDAWLRVNEATLSELAAAENVQRVQLMSQPKSYRRSWVQFEGWVRSARFVNRPITALGQTADDYKGKVGHYEFWIRPEETNAGPYCVYSLNLPAGFPELNEEHQTLNEKVRVVACFFKKRSYVSADSKPSVCPLLLAASFTRLNNHEGTKESATPWIPNVPAMIGIAVALALLAAGLAWLAWRTTQSPRYRPGDQTTGRIHDSLDQLADDPNVMTEREKVLQFQRSADANDSIVDSQSLDSNLSDQSEASGE